LNFSGSLKPGYDLRRHGDGSHFTAIAVCRPNAGFDAFSRDLTVKSDFVLHVKARSAEVRNTRANLNVFSERHRVNEIGLHIHKRESEYAEGARYLMALYAKRNLKELPGALVENLEKPTVEYEPRRVALTPFDGYRASIDE
jgi:hypothetical protein